MGKRGFTKVDNELFDYFSLEGFTHLHFAVYTALRSYRFTEDAETPVYPSVQSLCDKIALKSVRHMRKTLRELEAFGLISIAHRTGQSNYYYLHEPLDVVGLYERFGV
jgi:hypothetical protein